MESKVDDTTFESIDSWLEGVSDAKVTFLSPRKRLQWQFPDLGANLKRLLAQKPRFSTQKLVQRASKETAGNIHPFYLP